MRPLAAAFVVFLAATAVAQAHVPANCAATVSAATKATAELSASRADMNNWLSDWSEALGGSIRPFTMEEFTEFFALESRIADAQVLFDVAFEELIDCIAGS